MRNMDAIEALNEAKAAVVKLNTQIQKQKAEIEELRKFPDDTHRILKALLMSGHRVTFDPTPSPQGYGNTFMVSVRTSDNLKYQAHLPMDSYLGSTYTRSDGFAYAI